MPEALLSTLRARLAGLDALIAGRGEPLDLPVALLPEVSDPARAAAARAAAAHPGLAAAADVETAAPEGRPASLALVAAMAAFARHLDDPTPWHARVDEVRYDVLGRPHAWRDLSDAALLLAESLDLTEETPHGSLLRLVARAALDAVSAEELAAARAIVVGCRRRAGARRWRLWLEAHRGPDVLVRALEEAERSTREVPGDGPEACSVLGRALDGRIELVADAEGIALAWRGEGRPPDTASAGGSALAADGAGTRWRLPVPEADAIEVTLRRGDDLAVVRWTG